MEIHILTRSYNCYGGHRTLSLIGDFLKIQSHPNNKGAIDPLSAPAIYSQFTLFSPRAVAELSS